MHGACGSDHLGQVQASFIHPRSFRSPLPQAHLPASARLKPTPSAARSYAPQAGTLAQLAAMAVDLSRGGVPHELELEESELFDSMGAVESLADEDHAQASPIAAAAQAASASGSEDDDDGIVLDDDSESGSGARCTRGQGVCSCCRRGSSCRRASQAAAARSATGVV